MPVTFIQPTETKSYNERLFSGGFRSYFHAARFLWLRKAMQKLNIHSGQVIELGCFDGKSIEYLPFEPQTYTGYDANWEGGLDEAFNKWKNKTAYVFKLCNAVEDFNKEHQQFDYSIAMETLEHLPSAELEMYIQQLAAATKQYGFYTIPNESGIVFLLKYLTKKIMLKADEPYNFKEAWQAATGRQQKIKRTEGGHKGFDYKHLLSLLQRYFDMIEVKGLPFANLPLWMNFTIAITVKTKAFAV